MKVQTALRFDKDLLEIVKEKAKAQKRSLNNYIEFLLYAETQQAIYEAHNDINMTEVKDFDKWIASLKKGEFDV